MPLHLATPHSIDLALPLLAQLWQPQLHHPLEDVAQPHPRRVVLRALQRLDLLRRRVPREREARGDVNQQPVLVLLAARLLERRLLRPLPLVLRIDAGLEDVLRLALEAVRVLLLLRQLVPLLLEVGISLEPVAVPREWREELTLGALEEGVRRAADEEEAVHVLAGEV